MTAKPSGGSDKIRRSIICQYLNINEPDDDYDEPEEPKSALEELGDAWVAIFGNKQATNETTN